MLGISLVLVGIVLVMNGVGKLCKINPKATALMNTIVASILLTINIIMLTKASTSDDYLNVASGLLFAITYIFLAALNFFNMDPRPFGWYSLFVVIYAIVMAIVSFTSGVWLMGVLWIIWSLLWLEGFLELACKVKIGAIFPYLSIFEGAIACFIPGMLMLLNIIQNGVLVIG